MKTTTIRVEINCLQNEAGAKKLFAKTTAPKKNVCIDEISIPPLQKNNGPSLMTRYLHNTGGGRSIYLPALVKLGLSLTRTNFNSQSAVLTLPASESLTPRSNHSQSTLMQYANFHLQLRPLTFGAGSAWSTKYQTMPNYVI